MAKLPKAVKVTITDLEGVVLDQFQLAHWKNGTEDEDTDEENVGSPFANAGFIERLSRYMEVPK